MENKKEEKYYIRSNGEKIAISTMNTEHILNALGKKQREVFEAKNKSEADKILKEIKDLKEGYFAKFNEWYEKLGDE